MIISSLLLLFLYVGGAKEKVFAKFVEYYESKFSAECYKKSCVNILIFFILISVKLNTADEAKLFLDN